MKVAGLPTIIQLATPRAIGAIHVIRISGDKALTFLKRHVKTKNIVPRRVYYATFFAKKKALDKVIFFYSRSPKSFTGEDMVELQVHGSLLIVDQMLELALSEDLALAKAGEFSERAFLNGKMTLEMAEATNSLIHTNSLDLKENALKILEQKSSLEFSKLELSVQTIMAELESAIEFPEEDIPELDKPREELYSHYLAKVKEIGQYLEKISRNFLIGKKNSEGIKLSLLGLPNVGKSTLLNVLLNEKRVIVSEEAGTTRDFINESMVLHHFNLILLDTAGIRKTENEIERMGIEKSLGVIGRSDIVLVLLDDVMGAQKLLNFSFRKKQNLLDKHFLIYINKVDALDLTQREQIKREVLKWGLPMMGEISLLREPYESREKITKDLKNLLETNFSIPQNELALTSYRQYVIVNRLVKKLKAVEKAMQEFLSEELLVEEFRKLISDFSELNLKLHQEEIFNLLFRQFCIGK